MEKDWTVRCIACKAPWTISAEVVGKAQAVIVDEFPEECLVVVREDAFGYLCATCHEQARVLGRLPDKPRRRPVSGGKKGRKN